MTCVATFALGVVFGLFFFDIPASVRRLKRDRWDRARDKTRGGG